jgi:hypothetical protein
MLKNYLITTFRKLGRDRSYTAINVFGLALGITCSLMLFLLIKFELSFDTFHRKAERIYRINTVAIQPKGTAYTTGTPYPFSAAMRQDFRELEKVTVVDYDGEGLVTVLNEDKTPARFQEKSGVVFVEPDFFDIFDFAWIAGDPKTLVEPNSVALSEELAKKYFPNEASLGRTIRLNNKLDLKVTGVLKNFPANTDFPFKLLISFVTAKNLNRMSESWENLRSNLQTYVLLPEHGSPRQLEGRLPAFAKKYWYDETRPRAYTLQLLQEIHFNARFGNFNGRTISKSAIGLWPSSAFSCHYRLHQFHQSGHGAGDQPVERGWCSQGFGRQPAAVGGTIHGRDLYHHCISGHGCFGVGGIVHVTRHENSGAEHKLQFVRRYGPHFFFNYHDRGGEPFVRFLSCLSIIWLSAGLGIEEQKHSSARWGIAAAAWSHHFAIRHFTSTHHRHACHYRANGLLSQQGIGLR